MNQPFAKLLADFRVSIDGTAPSGLAKTGVPGVSFFWDETHIDRAPLLYDTGLVIIGQGHKVGYLGGQQFVYGSEMCLVIGVPVPFECEAHGSPEEPLLGLRVDIDLPALHGLVARLKAKPASEAQMGVKGAPLEGGLLNAVVRLAQSIQDPMDAEVLGSGAVEEVIYRVLQSEAGNVLYALTQHHSAYASIARALERMHSDYRDGLSVEELAQESSMSVSAFHRAFKNVTGETPIQYLKKIRLIKAKGLLVVEGARVEQAAYEVGYSSASQFSREFKRYFNVPPSEADSLPYGAAV